MRTLVILLSLACAHQNANQQPPQQPPLDAVQVRACESCRHNLQLCREHTRVAEPASVGTQSADCMQDFMTCLGDQQLDSARCQGMN
jgi:hypothetical protein